MAEADYRLMTEATGQRIAAALEALSLNGVTWSDVVNTLTATERSVLDARQGKALNDAKLDKNFATLPTAATPYANTDLVPLYRNGTVYSTDMQTLINSAGGGGGTQQGALSNYAATYSFSAANTTHTFADSNLTAQMVIVEAYAPNNVSVSLTPNITDGSITFTGTVSADCSIVFYFGVGLATAPLLLVNLGSNDADNLLKAAPRPGVYNVLGLRNGGTGVNATDNSDLLDKIGVTAAIQQSAANRGEYTELGRIQGAGTVTLSDSIKNYKYLYARVGYYATGNPTFGSAFLPVSVVPVNSDSTYKINIVTIDNNTVGSVSINFSNNTTLNVINATNADFWLNLQGIK